ncbi:hypothetical protein HWV62_8709 [Athelia sp. TMB]|nr:hypothetical protein HWV62_8709 [Athelia sp. TMB]
MSDFLKSSLSSGASQAERKQQIMQSVRSEIALANAQELITTTNDKCFAKCVLKPSTALSSSEEVSPLPDHSAPPSADAPLADVPVQMLRPIHGSL